MFFSIVRISGLTLDKRGAFRYASPPCLLMAGVFWLAFHYDVLGGAIQYAYVWYFRADAHPSDMITSEVDIV